MAAVERIDGELSLLGTHKNITSCCPGLYIVSPSVKPCPIQCFNFLGSTMKHTQYSKAKQDFQLNR